MDGGASPSEISSGRMCAGGGSGARRSAATEEASAAETAATLTSHVAWLHAAAAQCQQMAAQARAAARAHEAAYAMTVPPPLIEANRTLMQILVTHNALGQSTPAIAAAEAAYGEMWAQDVAAMHRYAAASASATAAIPFTAPNPSATPGTPMTTIPDLLGKLASPGCAETMLPGAATDLDRHLTARWGSFFTSAISDGKSPTPMTEAVDSAATAPPPAREASTGAGHLAELDAVSVNLGLATSRGALSVPQSWLAN